MKIDKKIRIRINATFGPTDNFSSDLLRMP